MKTNPTLETDISSYFDEIVAEKERAGINLPLAKQIAVGQIYKDTQVGLLDLEKAARWLISHEVEQGTPPEAATLHVREHLPARKS